MKKAHAVLIPLLSFSSGIVAGFSLHPVIPLWAISALLLLMLISVLNRNITLSFVSIFSITVFWFFMGVYSMAENYTHKPGIPGVRDGDYCTVEGIIAGRPCITSEGEKFELEVVRRFFPDGSSVAINNARILVNIESGVSEFERGDKLRIPGHIRYPRKLGLPGEFDYPSYLALNGINATLRIKDPESALLVYSSAQKTIMGYLDSLALSYESRVRKTVSNNEVAPILIAMVTGSQSSIPSDLRNAYARAGVLHILSVSGFHIAVITSIFVFLLYGLLIRIEWLALRINVRTLAVISSVPVMILYMLFTGAAPATVRAVVMLLAVVAALVTERNVNPLDSLFFAAFLMLVLNPSMLFDLGFQLSFLSLWGIIVLTPLIIMPFEGKLTDWRRKLAVLIASSLAASLATAIPSIAQFHQASIVAVFSNIIIVPMLGYGALILGIASLPLVLLLPAVSKVVLIPLSYLIEVSNYLVRFFSKLPVLTSYSFGATSIALAVLALVYISISNNYIRIFKALIVVMVTFVILESYRESSFSGLKIHFLSVGHGDSFFIQFPDKSNMLVDGGGYLYDNGLDFGARYLVPALRSIGVKKIDRMVLTHPHPDHIGGLSAVAEQFKVKKFYYAAENDELNELKRLRNALVLSGTEITTLKKAINNHLFSAGEVDMSYSLAPDDITNDENDNSIVLHLKYYDFKALFMGDAGIPVEMALLKSGIEKYTLLKAGHHGSRTSSSESFVKTIRPKTAVVSAGYGNRFGLPSKEVINRFERYGSLILRTDLDGTIILTTNGMNWNTEKTLDSI